MKKVLKIAPRLLFTLAAALATTPTACGGSGLVGGDCADGYAFCDGVCIDVQSDDENCGGCGLSCAGAESCAAGVCVAGSGGAPAGGGSAAGGFAGGLGGSSGGVSSGGSAGSGGAGGSGGAPSGGSAGSGGTGGGGACLPPYDKPGACGDCDTVCTEPAPLCAPLAGSFECVENCDVDPFTTSCGGTCVDTETDALHCGDCNQFCPSGICVSGGCIGASPGHMIALCMNYEQFYPSAAQTVLLGNSVFMTNQEPARILAYTGYSPSGLRATTNAAIGAAANVRGRTYQLTEETNAAAVLSNLSRTNYDVLVVYDQPTAPLGQLETIGDSWASMAETFAEDGGIVVVLAGHGGTAEMGEMVSSLGILEVTGLTDQVAERFYVQAPGDALAINVVSPFLGIAQSCSFDTAQVGSGDRVFVITDTNPTNGVGAPAVVHRIVQP